MSSLVGTNPNMDCQHVQESHPSAARGDGPGPYEVSACHMPVAWPMHTGAGVGGAVAGGMMWIQPVYWPVYSTSDSIQVGGPWDATQGSDMKGMPFHQGPQQTSVGTFVSRKQRRSRHGCQAVTR